MIKAIIFDMDGLLIDSEPFWEEAEIEIFNKIDVPVTYEGTFNTMGLRIDEVVEYWYKKYPWIEPSKKQIEKEIVKKVIELVNKKGEVLPGVFEILKHFWNQKIPMAIASSSQMSIINAVIKKLEIKKYFQLICSAEYEKFGKPDPGIYLTTAKKLGLKPEDCLVFEDSPNGVISAKKAGMICIAVPSKKINGDSRFKLADKTINSLSDFDERFYFS